MPEIWECIDETGGSCATYPWSVASGVGRNTTESRTLAACYLAIVRKISQANGNVKGRSEAENAGYCLDPSVRSIAL